MVERYDWKTRRLGSVEKCHDYSQAYEKFAAYFHTFARSSILVTFWLLDKNTWGCIHYEDKKFI